MSDSQITQAAPLPPSPTGYLTGPALANLAPGEPVYFNASGQFAAANAAADGTASVVGLTARPALATQDALVYYSGPLTLTVAQWNARETGATTGLTPNATYYLSDAAAGKITRTPVTTEGHRVACLGTALSSTTLLISALPGVDHT